MKYYKLVTRPGLILFIIRLISTHVEAQIVTIDPAFFTINDVITITYDASMGNAGLAGASQVYAGSMCKVTGGQMTLRSR